MKFNNLAEEFLTHCQYERGLDEKTLKAYRIDLRQLAEALDFGCTTPICNVDRDMIRKYLKTTCASFKPRTIRRKIACLKSFFGHLELEDVITVSPIRKMRISIKAPKEIPKTIPLSNIRQLFKHIYSLLSQPHITPFQQQTLVRDIAIIELLFATGMRVSEISSLTLNQVHLAQNLITVKGKGNKERLIPICADEVKSVLKMYLKHRTNNNKGQQFFLNRRGNRISSQSIRFMVKKYTTQAKVKLHITPHMFRHTMATQLLNEGMDIRYIQDLLGHSSISITQIYAQVSDTARRKEIRKRHPRRNMQFTNEESNM